MRKKVPDKHETIWEKDLQSVSCYQIPDESKEFSYHVNDF